ncbi:MAG TPA: carbohydrate-binding protein [Candidatus Limnocylindrales bacterium]|nr:carbohydrate-binding protein [Candidatus Limnocylindrales bacterium]
MKRRAGAVLACVTLSVFFVDVAWAAPTRYEAENAPATCDGTIDSNNAGFSGTGFCNTNNAVGAAAQFTVSAGSAGTATIQIRYANGGTVDRQADILVNGANVQPAGSFGPTGAWTTWVTKTLTAQVNTGNNTIRLNATTANGLANIDFIDFEVGGTTQPPTGKQMEDLNRGLVSLRSGTGNFVSWRMLGTDPSSVSYRLFRSGTLVASQSHTNFFDNGAPQGASYTVRAVINGVEGPDSEAALQVGSGGFLDVPLQVPGGGTTPDGVAFTYSANDASVGDLDGDGQYEFVVKWDPSNSKDNSQSGYTGNVFVDAYRLNGQRMWRIDLGRNIRAGAHYTQFQVYDYDGDGRAEVAMKTADATISGTGQVIGNASADFRNTSGYILSGPEFLTMFDGLNGSIRSTVNYNPPRGTVSSWGDSYGNRVDRFLAATAYLDGQRPSLIMTRGYYTRAVIAAWDFRNGSLTQRWVYDSGNSGGAYGMGNHNLSIADVDADGRDEIIYGSATINDNGTFMYGGFGHGDALHVGDLIPSRSGLEVWTIHESTSQPGADVHDARTGQVIWQRPNNNGVEGPGRAVAADIYAGSAGAEFWGSGPNMTNLFNTSGASVGRTPSSANHLIWWDADPVRELLDQTRIDKYGTGGDTRLLTASGVASNNGTKANPAVTGDLFGDWREEAVWRTSNSSALRIYFTPTPTTTRIFTLMHDPQYRVAIAWQNTAYNQPPHPSFFLGNGMSTPNQPNIYVR